MSTGQHPKPRRQTVDYVTADGIELVVTAPDRPPIRTWTSRAWDRGKQRAHQPDGSPLTKPSVAARKRARRRRKASA